MALERLKYKSNPKESWASSKIGVTLICDIYTFILHHILVFLAIFMLSIEKGTYYVYYLLHSVKDMLESWKQENATFSAHQRPPPLPSTMPAIFSIFPYHRFPNTPLPYISYGSYSSSSQSIYFAYLICSVAKNGVFSLVLKIVYHLCRVDYLGLPLYLLPLHFC